VPLRFRIRPPAHAGGITAVERTIDVESGSGAVTLGRRADVAIQLPYATVSALHARVAGSPGSWTIEDLGSANGTFLVARRPDPARANEGSRLAPRQAHPLAEGDILRLAEVTVVFLGLAVDASRGPEGITETTATLARRLVNDFFGACRPAEVARVVVEKGRDVGRSMTLTTVGHIYRVGRASECDLVLTDDDVSREHVAFERRWDGVEVRDLGSKNGVAIGGKRLEGPRRLRDGEAVVLSGTRLRLEDPEDRYLRQMQEEEEGRRTIVGPDPDPGGRAENTAASPESGEGGPAEVPPAARAGPAPIVIAAVAVLVLAGLAAVVAWLFLGQWH
jgi:pSer/pThr/pTyr-binding forkhead associated (FHA) protein